MTNGFAASSPLDSMFVSSEPVAEPVKHTAPPAAKVTPQVEIAPVAEAKPVVRPARKPLELTMAKVRKPVGMGALFVAMINPVPSMMTILIGEAKYGLLGQDMQLKMTGNLYAKEHHFIPDNLFPFEIKSTPGRRSTRPSTTIEKTGNFYNDADNHGLVPNGDAKITLEFPKPFDPDRPAESHPDQAPTSSRHRRAAWNHDYQKAKTAVEGNDLPKTPKKWDQFVIKTREEAQANDKGKGAL